MEYKKHFMLTRITSKLNYFDDLMRREQITSHFYVKKWYNSLSLINKSVNYPPPRPGHWYLSTRNWWSCYVYGVFGERADGARMDCDGGGVRKRVPNRY